MFIHWHRRDLRPADVPGLSGAHAADRVVPVFVFDDDVLEHAGAPRVAFMLDALESLREWYRDRGGDLLVVRGDPAVELPRLAAKYDADRVTLGQDYSGLARTRDERVGDALADEGVERDARTDAVLHEPGGITTTDGDHYSVYSYYWKKWRDRPKAEPYEPPDADGLADVSGHPIPSLDDLGFDEPEADVPSASLDAARERLSTFLDGPVFEYADRRDYPADGCTSGLSPHLKFGTIGVRETYAAADEAWADAPDESARSSVEEFLGQLAWREFYIQVLDANPETVAENFKSYEREIAWRNDSEEFRAWKDGETGYPIVDAGMRQLRAEATMHNRIRMIVASFLTKDLLVDWRRGYAWFRERLVDHETANDVGGWQWAASTGTDAQPYFRVFNPTTQGERYDPEAEYVKTHVPELRDVDADLIHEWPDLSEARRDAVAPEYPAPIVDHGERREAAIAAFESARGGE